MLTHTVMFRLRRPLDADEREVFVAALRRFAAEAPPTAGPMVIGTDVGLRDPGRPGGGDVSLSTTFADTEAFAAYLDHPGHRAVVSEVVEPMCESWLSMQEEMRPQDDPSPTFLPTSQ